LTWTFRAVDRRGQLSASRIDLILANHAAMMFVRAVSVVDDVRDGGHSPVLVELSLSSGVIDWRPPRPQLPPLLRQSSAELRASPLWTSLVDEWQRSPPARAALAPRHPPTLESHSGALLRALQHLVDLAGGWATRSAHRRPAYASDDLRRARRSLSLLHRLDALIERDMRSSSSTPAPGCWTRPWVVLLDALLRERVSLPRTTSAALQRAVTSEALQCRDVVARMEQEMRRERRARWKAGLATMWRERPGAIQHWLRATDAPWGSRPVLDSSGLQCLTVETVDAAVRGYWVDVVLRQHAGVDATARWAAFEASEFGAHVPAASWPSTPWTGERVRSVLSSMREAAAPGLTGIPIAVWRSLPSPWHDAVARLLELVEAAGRWPAEWLQAYVAMIPKASGGSRPRDQRPITVLEVMYRIWSKGVVLEWTPTLHTTFLGTAAFGFRAQSGTLHVAQMLSDLMALQQRRRRQLWLASFDVEKCFDSLPWWAVFGTLRRAGVRPAVVDCFADFYQNVRRRFRYGRVDGGVWRATNGLAQGCPASPDLLNILFEAFHRWAVAAGHGVEVSGVRVPSASFADDVALLAPTLESLESLIASYLEWCALLGVRVTKMQVWSSLGTGHAVQVGPLTATTTPTFRFVGVELGLHEREVTEAHFAPRLAKALATTQRLRTLDLPASFCSLLWRSTVLPQALYGCELRDVRAGRLAALSQAGKAAVCTKPPLYLNMWRAPEVATGPPLGASAVCDPMFAVRERQLRWLQLLANLPSLAGCVHRAAAGRAERWREPSAALRSAVKSLGWSVRRNLACSRASQWPWVAPEASYPGSVSLSPVDSFPAADAVFTDGSLSRWGGAAVWSPDTETAITAAIPAPRSSTHCELAALCLAVDLSPPLIITDSLCSLQLALHWGTWPTTRTLACADRAVVRQLVATALACPQPPALEKVKAHDAAALAIGYPKAVGNDVADMWARRAAEEPGHPVWAAPSAEFADPVELLDSAGLPILDVRSALGAAWWRRVRARRLGRPRIDMLFLPDVPISWGASTGVFRRPVCQPSGFAHVVPPAVIKWTARVRCGCLATRARLHRHHLVDSAACLCCGEASEDDAHVLAGCPATGTSDSLAILTEAWQEAAVACGLQVPLPGTAWLEAHTFPLLAALIPESALHHATLPAPEAARFLNRLHLALAAATAERLRRRGSLMDEYQPPPLAEPPAAPAPLPASSGLRHACPLPRERQLSVPALRQLEIARRGALDAPPALAPVAVPPPAVPACGEPRRRWVRNRLVQLINEDTSPCPAAQGSTSEVLLELFERITGEPATDAPGVALESRRRAFAKVLGNVTQEVAFDPPLQTVTRRSYKQWNRVPNVPADILAWRRRTERLEAAHPAVRRRTQMAAVDARLPEWIRGHQFLQPAEVDRGESSMALLLLWEVDHGVPFPTGAAGGLSDTLMGFTRRLMAQVQADDELTWLEHREMQVPLAPGLVATHHTRWSLRVVAPPPGVGRAWYDTYLERWHAYLATQLPTAMLEGDVASSSATAALPPVVAPAQPLRRPREPSPPGPQAAPAPKRRRAIPAHRVLAALPRAEEAADPLPAAPPPPQRPPAQRRPREPAPPAETAEPAPKRRQSDLRGFLRPKAPAEAAPAPMPPRRPHGRAAEGPPT
jgi:hypothetical protein